MPEVARKIVWSILGAIISAIVGLIAREVLQAWGVLDPFSEWLGGWLKMHVSPPQAGWTVAGIVTLAAYAALLWLVWKRHRIPQTANVALVGALKSSATNQRDAGPDRYMTAYEVIHYIADDSKWGDEVRRNPSGQISTRFGTINAERMPVLEAQVEFKRVAEQGHIHAVGRFDGVGPHVHIPETYWMSATINPFSLDNPDVSETMRAGPNPDGIHTYKGVRIVREDVERAWPPATKKK
jgi:hypothetical protein